MPAPYRCRLVARAAGLQRHQRGTKRSEVALPIRDVDGTTYRFYRRIGREFGGTHECAIGVGVAAQISVRLPELELRGGVARIDTCRALKSGKRLRPLTLAPR